MKFCVFCDIVEGKEDAARVYEDEHYLSFMDKGPVNPGHTLVIPKKHYEVIMDMPSEEAGSLFAVAAKVARGVEKAVSADGINLFQMNGAAAWQDVPHVHVHVVPRFFGDEIRIHWPAVKAEIVQLRRIGEVIRKYIE